MRIYLAGGSKDIGRCKHLIALLRALGHEVTFDWPAHIEANGGDPLAGTDESFEAAAELCLDGALDADIVWVANPSVDKPTAGAWGEMVGAVLYSRLLGAGGMSNGPKVIISAPADLNGPLLKQFCIFQHLRGVTRFDSDAQALAYISQLADRRPDDRSPEGA